MSDQTYYCVRFKPLGKPILVRCYAEEELHNLLSCFPNAQVLSIEDKGGDLTLIEDIEMQYYDIDEHPHLFKKENENGNQHRHPRDSRNNKYKIIQKVW